MLSVRRATEADCRLLWEWANDPAVRAQSFTQTPIPWDDHARWFHARIASPVCAIYIISDEAGRPIGQVRFDLQAGAEAELDVSVSSEHRGLGLAAEALRKACLAFGRESDAALVAYVKPDNTASLRAFERAGFVRAGPQHRHGTHAVRLECTDACVVKRCTRTTDT